MTTQGEYQHIEVELLEAGTVLDLRLAGGKGNILDTAMMGELDRALDQHRDAAALRLVLLRGAEKNFSFGASIDEHTKAKVGAMLPAFHGLIRKMASYPVPLAALVHGRCLGGAFELVLACHFVFATADAVFSCPEVKLGVFPPVLAVLGPERLGSATAARLLHTGGELGATAAERIGWLSRIISVDDSDPADANARAEAAQASVLDWYRENLAPLSPFSLRQATHAVRQHGGILQAVDAPLAAAEKQYLEQLVNSHDGNEGIEAFMARRKPVWSNA